MTDLKMNLRVAAQAIEGQAKIFGPVFPRLVAQNWVRFVAEKIGETPPDAESLQQALDYVEAKIEKYPKAYTGSAYAICKATATLEGQLGVGTASLAKNAVKPDDWSNELLSRLGAVSGTTDALNKYIRLTEALGIYTPGMLVGSGDGVDSTLSVHNCEYAEACDRLLKEGIGRRKGERECFIGGVMISKLIAMVTKRNHDCKNVKMVPPNCEVKIYQTT
jgi:hypothetical protein